MGVFNFIINEIFGQGAIFIALIACIGLILQKKSFSEIIRGTVMIAVGFFILSTGTGLITGSSIDGISTAFNTIVPRAVESKTVDIGTMYGTEIGIVMIAAFAINLFIARFTRWKSIFLTGHMLYWFPYVFIAAGVDAGLTGGKLIILAAAFTALYMVVSPNLMRPFVKKVTGDDPSQSDTRQPACPYFPVFSEELWGTRKNLLRTLKYPHHLDFCGKLLSLVPSRLRLHILSCTAS